MEAYLIVVSRFFQASKTYLIWQTTRATVNITGRLSETLLNEKVFINVSKAWREGCFLINHIS